LGNTKERFTRGSVLVVRVMFIKEKYGDQVFERVISRLDPAAQQLLRGTIDPKASFPHDITSKFTKAIRDELDGGKMNIFNPLSVVTAEYDLKNTIPQYNRVGDPTYAFNHLELIIRYYWGDLPMDIRATGKNQYRVRFAKTDRLSEAMCTYSFLGFLEGVVKAGGGRNPKVEKVSCIHKGAEFCEYHVQWE
jgi:hypothetical protein